MLLQNNYFLFKNVFDTFCQLIKNHLPEITFLSFKCELHGCQFPKSARRIRIFKFGLPNTDGCQSVCFLIF